MGQFFCRLCSAAARERQAEVEPRRRGIPSPQWKATVPTKSTWNSDLPVPTPEGIADLLLEVFDANQDDALDGDELFAALRRVLSPESLVGFTREKSDTMYAQCVSEGYDMLRRDDLATMMSEADDSELRRINSILKRELATHRARRS